MRAVLILCALACAVATSAWGGVREGVPVPDFFPSATPQLRLQHEYGQSMLTLLGDGMLHIAYDKQLKAGPPYLSPMVTNRAFAGPRQYRWDARRRTLSAEGLQVQVAGECWAIADARVSPAAPLARLCPATWKPRRLKLTWTTSDSAEVLGLGQHLDPGIVHPSWTGRERRTGHPLGNAMTYSSIGGSGDTQVPVAYVLGGPAPYGLFFDTPYALQFDFRDKDWSVESNDGALGLFLFSGSDLRSLRRSYMELTGRPPVPPLKAFGLWLSEYGYDNWAELDDKLATLRGRGFPIDGAVLDLQWFGGILSGAEATSMGRLSWDEKAFPDAAARIEAYAEQGLGLMLIEESYIGKALPEHAQLAKQGLLAMDCPPPCGDAVLLDKNPWWGVGGMLDWSNPAAGSWWHTHKRRALIDDGVLGHWTDLGEPEQFDEQAYYHGLEWYGRSRQGHRDIHNLYNFLWSRSIAQETAGSHPQRRPWILSRSGTAGSQRFGVAMWSGDVTSSFDALSAQMRAQSNMSLSGFDYYGSDVGGFQRQAIGSKELDALYTRWFAGSALLDIPLRPHVMNLCNCTETAPDRVGHADSNRAALQLRYRLLPYLYSLAHAAWSEGEAMFPPLAYHFPADFEAVDVAGSKMMGPWLLFAPPVTPGKEQDVYLPAGRWTDFYRPVRTITSRGGSYRQSLFDEGLLRAPLFLREGAIVPMLREVPAHLGRQRPGTIHRFSDLLIRAVPASRPSRFVLVEDDGISRAYEQGQLARTVLETAAGTRGHYRFSLRPEPFAGAAAKRTVRLELLGTGRPGKVTLNGRPLLQLAAEEGGVGWFHGPAGTMLLLGEHAVDEALEIRIEP